MTNHHLEDHVTIIENQRHQLTDVRRHARPNAAPIIAAGVVSVGVGAIAIVAATMDTVGTVPTVACLVVSAVAAGDATRDIVRSRKARK